MGVKTSQIRGSLLPFIGAILLSSCSAVLPSKAVVENRTLQLDSIQGAELTIEEDGLGDWLGEIFQQFYTVDLKKQLVLNQYPVQIGEPYWEAYKAYEAELDSVLGMFLEKQELPTGFLTAKIDLPRFVELNGVTIVGYGEMEAMEYQILQETEDYIRIQADVVLGVEVLSNNKFDALYTYDPSIGYYRNTGKDIEAYGDELDAIKVSCSYTLEISQKEEQRVLAVLKENQDIPIYEQNRRKKENNGFVTRSYYTEEVPNTDALLIRKFFQSFLRQDEDGYRYYKYAYDTSYEAVLHFFTMDLDLEHIVDVRPEQYRSQFPLELIPTKDGIVSVSPGEDISIEVHMASSRKNGVYRVSVPVTALFYDGSQKQLEYAYTVLIQAPHEKRGIASIQYIAKEEIIRTEDEESQ